MSDTYHFQLYKKLDATGRIALEPFIRMLWEHGLAFTSTALPESLTWEQAWQGSSTLYDHQELRDLPLVDALAMLEKEGGCLNLFDKQMGYQCWFEWIRSPAHHPILSLRLIPPSWALQVGIHVGWHTSTDRDAFLQAGYQQGMASFLHWSAICCQWFQPELAGSYEAEVGQSYQFPPALLNHLDTNTFPERPQWGWMMYLPAHILTAPMLSNLIQTPELTIHSLMPGGLHVYQMPTLYRYETRAGYELQNEALQRLPNTDNRAAAEKRLRGDAQMYQRAITLFQSAHHATGEALARIGIEQVTSTIEIIRTIPTLEETRQHVRERMEQQKEQ